MKTTGSLKPYRKSCVGIELVFAYSLDLLIGDPRWIPHPVRGLGLLINTLESYLRKLSVSLRFAGAILTVSVVIASYMITWFLLYLAGLVSPVLAAALNVLFIFMSLSARSLAQAAEQVLLGLERDDIHQARKRLGEIVSRETESLDRNEIVRGTVETVAENTVDGFISPLFYAALGGAPLVWAYKAINTLDSMIGYKDARYLDFGWFAARLDDIANFLPARLSALIIPVAAFLIKEDAPLSIKTVISDRKNSESPNAGYPESAFAGALKIQLGGPNIYRGTVSDRPLIGRALRPKEPRDIKRAVRLMYASSFISIMAGVLVS